LQLSACGCCTPYDDRWACVDLSCSGPHDFSVWSLISPRYELISRWRRWRRRWRWWWR
jgi:hypothetical protein